MGQWHDVGQKSFPAIVLGAVTLLVHFVFNNRYGIFSDELYFIVCGQHPALGYVDQPPLVPFIAASSYALFGTALLPLRLVPALAMAVTVALTAEFARALGGGRFAQWLAGITVVLGGVFLVDGLLLLTDCLQPLTWLGCGWCVLRLAQTRNERWWIAFGIIAGISLLSKYLILFFLAGLAVGVIATPLRRSFRCPELYLGAAIALVLASPSLIWQATHGWPFLELGQTAVNGKNLQLTPLAFFGQQVLFVGPAAVPIWLAGLWCFSIKPPFRELRVFPIAYAVMALMFLTLHGKAYYIVPIYPVLLAGGAVAIEAWLVWRLLRGVALATVTVIGIVLAPLALPILPPEKYASYAASLGIPSGAAATERGRQGPLPTHLAGMFGWPEMAAKVAAVYNALPADERANAVFYGRDYGEAAALDIYGPPLHGPPVVAGQNNYYLWGPKGYDGSVVIVLFGDVTPLMKNYRDVRIVGRIDSPFAQSDEAHMPIFVLRRPRLPLKILWPQLKHYE
jgi:4-amino-4-deoxy-L-arabinose transferase-like glycosyltransferase